VAKEMNVPAQTDMQPIKTSYDVVFNPKDIDTYLKTTKK
jgi:nitrate/nitrite transport system substrate-binding protein